MPGIASIASPAKYQKKSMSTIFLTYFHEFLVNVPQATQPLLHISRKEKQRSSSFFSE
jgi:hypothetical protein